MFSHIGRHVTDCGTQGRRPPLLLQPFAHKSVSGIKHFPRIKTICDWINQKAR
jgi:hypothetical protein